MLIISFSKLIKLNLFASYFYTFLKMRKYLFALLFAVLLVSCSKDSPRNKNPFLPDYSFSIAINTNLPLYSGLNTPVNPVFIHDDNAGIAGIIAMKVSDSDYRAWEASCPNQYPSSCSVMAIDGLNAKCSCEDFTYSLFTGVGSGAYTMKAYRVEVQGNTIRIYN
jgi:nitrite reductase/ring-hydroxylating ferredoxin subunit